MNTSGMQISTVENAWPVNAETSSMNAEKSKNDAKAAEPIAYPFVVAFVVFPTASSSSHTSRTESGWLDISTIPPALSAIGPNTSMVKT